MQQDPQMQYYKHLHSSCLIGLILNPENGCTTFLLNVRELLLDYNSSNPKSRSSSLANTNMQFSISIEPYTMNIFFVTHM
jgi:hypothetical protein